MRASSQVYDGPQKFGVVSARNRRLIARNLQLVTILREARGFTIHLLVYHGL